jgi:hypothetical protein
MKRPALAWFHGNPELGITILEFFLLLDANVASIAVGLPEKGKPIAPQLVSAAQSW